jgi:hypothetical protein
MGPTIDWPHVGESQIDDNTTSMHQNNAGRQANAEQMEAEHHVDQNLVEAAAMNAGSPLSAAAQDFAASGGV